jgi:DNA polymerase-1
MEKKESENFLIIDGNSIIHRAFHALPPLTNKKGEIVNAVYGFLLMFFRAIKDFNPKYIAACFDLPEPTFRKQAFADYKAKRVKAPDELYAQIPEVKKFLKAFNVAIFEKSGYEGDDLIGTLSEAINKPKFQNIKNIIISGDLDNLQLINNQTSVYFLFRGIKQGIIYNEQEVQKKYDGLKPEDIIVLKSLKGDSSDNIPGVKGVGEKTAIQLVKKYKNLENIYQEAEKENSEIKDSLRQKLIENKETAFLSRELSEIKKDVPIKIDIIDCSWQEFSKEKVRELLEDFGFKSLLTKLPGEKDFFIKPKKKKKLEQNISENLKLW